MRNIGSVGSVALVAIIGVVMAFSGAVAIADGTESDSCPRGFGYWKTHSEYGPAPHDDTWAQLTGGADTEFFLSGASYLDLLHSPMMHRGAYHILARAFIAAELNVRAGAEISPEAEAAWDAAAEVFAALTPAEVAQLSPEDLSELLDLAEILRAYVECDDDLIDIIIPDPDIDVLPTPGPNTQECTLGYGYWKTHSENGPAPYDDTWAELPEGVNTDFYLSDGTYFDVLWTSPKGGNAYYILAHKFIAIEMNVRAGADIPEDVEDAWNAAAEMFDAFTPAEIGDLKGNERHDWLTLASMLGDYNDGVTGPGSCDDDDGDGEHGDNDDGEHDDGNGEYDNGDGEHDDGDDDLDLPSLVDIVEPEPEPELTPTPVANTQECTLGFGYWKTHSEHGPAPFDDTWSELPEGANTEFYISGQSYHDVLWTPPKGGNAYYILAHSFIAAELNVLAGAELSDDAEVAHAEAADMFAQYTPEEVGELKGNERKPWMNLASMLSRHNDGIAGPGNCNDMNGDGGVDAVDVQLVVNEVLKGNPSVGAPKIQLVINGALGVY